MRYLFVIFAGLLIGCRSAGAATNQWNTFVLWSNQVLSASLKYMPATSVADVDYMFVEFDNHTDKVLDVTQAWLGLPGTVIDPQTQKSRFMSDMADGVVFIGKLPPGITKAKQLGMFESGLANLGLPPKSGCHVEIMPRAHVRLADGTTYAIPDARRKFSFEFNYPNPTEVEYLKARFKELLAPPDNQPDNQFAAGYYLQALSQVPEVADSVTLDELLSALQSHSWVAGKGAINTVVGRRFPDDPKVLSYFVDQLARDNGDAYFSFPRAIWKNPVFIEPLVKRYEQKGAGIMELLQLRPQWITNQQIVMRLSTALFKKTTLLNRQVAELSGPDLCAWRAAVADAGIIGDKNFLHWLEPALGDKRVIPDCLSKYDSRPRPLWNPRICDCALEAILMIVDGDSQAAFQKAGIANWRTEAEAYAAHDRISTDLAERLKRSNLGHEK